MQPRVTDTSRPARKSPIRIPSLSTQPTALSLRSCVMQLPSNTQTVTSSPLRLGVETPATQMRVSEAER